MGRLSGAPATPRCPAHLLCYLQRPSPARAGVAEALGAVPGPWPACPCALPCWLLGNAEARLARTEGYCCLFFIFTRLPARPPSRPPTIPCDLRDALLGHGRCPGHLRGINHLELSVSGNAVKKRCSLVLGPSAVSDPASGYCVAHPQVCPPAFNSADSVACVIHGRGVCSPQALCGGLGQRTPTAIPAWGSSATTQGEAPWETNLGHTGPLRPQEVSAPLVTARRTRQQPPLVWEPLLGLVATVAANSFPPVKGGVCCSIPRVGLVL